VFADDHTARIGAWQEGAALSAHRATELISAQVRAKKMQKQMPTHGH